MNLLKMIVLLMKFLIILKKLKIKFLFILLKDNLWEKVEDVGIKKERMEDALLYLREDEEKGGKTVLDENELSLLHSFVLSMIKG